MVAEGAKLFLIDPDLWKQTRAGARAGRGFRYQDAVAAWLLAEAWSGHAAWSAVVPEGADDIDLYGSDHEVRTQIKSRHDARARFSITEVAEHLAKTASRLPSDNPKIRLGLVLERPVDGLGASGWEAVLSETGQNLEPLISSLSLALARIGLASQHAAALMSRIHLVVEPEPIERAVAALATATPAVALTRLAVQKLRENAGAAADANYLALAERPASLGRTDVQVCLDTVQGLFDPQAYLELTAGLVEAADFTAPISTDGFYEGVDVNPAHVGAGLVFERPAAMADVLATLEARGRVLIAGPSGAGKSALAWLAAYHTRHAVRWYRVRRVQAEDVGRLVLLVRQLEASQPRPIGLVVDDVGRQDTAGWDALVLEAENFSGLLLVGTVREEDVFLLSSAAGTTIVRPELDEPLAERLWKSLTAQDQAKFAHWREPFEESQGLLLEYVHLLTAGERLAATLVEQVRRRLVEQRDDEVAILRVVSFAAAHGGSVDAERLRVCLGLNSIGLARALQRLIDEHALRSTSDGKLAGLHEIRSTYLDIAIRSAFGEPVSGVLTDVVATLSADTFAPFLVQTLRAYPNLADDVLEALVLRMRPDAVEDWVPILHGLGLATADIVAKRWLVCSAAAEIDDRFSATMFGLVLADGELESELFANAMKARSQFMQAIDADLRSRLIERLPDGLQAPSLDLSMAVDLSAALLPIKGADAPPLMNVGSQASLADADLDLVLRLLAIIGDRDRQAAIDLAALAGGVETLLDRIYHSYSWVMRPKLGEEDGLSTVTAHLRFIHPDVQPDPNQAVVDLCEKLAAAAPGTDLVISDLVNPDGQPHGLMDFQLARKRMPRRNLPAPARIAWNRAQLRAIARQVAAPNSTGRTTALAGAVSEIAPWVREAGDFFCRRERPSTHWQALLQVRRLLTSFVRPAKVSDAVTGPLAFGDLPGADQVYGFATGLERLMVELTDGVSEKPGLMAGRTAELAHTANSLMDAEVWRNAASPPLAVLAEIRDTLWQIRAVLGEAALDPDTHRQAALKFGTSSRKYSVLTRAAANARQRADARTARQCAAIEAAFAEAGLSTMVKVRANAEDGGWLWPDVEYAAFLEVESVLEFLALEATFKAVAETLGLHNQLSLVPILNGQTPPIALSYLTSVLPDLGFLQRWGTEAPYPSLRDDPARTHFEQAIDALLAISSINAERGRELNAEESAFFDRTLTRLTDNFTSLVELIGADTESPDEIALEVAQIVNEGFDRLKRELDGEDGPGGLALELLGTMRGEIKGFSEKVILARMLLMQRSASEGASAEIKTPDA